MNDERDRGGKFNHDPDRNHNPSNSQFWLWARPDDSCPFPFCACAPDPAYRGTGPDWQCGGIANGGQSGRSAADYAAIFATADRGSGATSSSGTTG